MVDSRRIRALDVTRGLIMALMAWDHTALLVAQQHASGEYWGGPFPSYRSAGPFLARLATHPCAPGFAFAMGIGIALFVASRRARGWIPWAIDRHLLLRGAILIALQFGVVNRIWKMAPGGWGLDVYVGVLYALGACMMLATLLRRLPTPWLLGLTLLLVAISPLWVPPANQWGRIPSSAGLNVARRLLYLPGGTRKLWANYSALPWLAFVCGGLLYGRWLRARPEACRRVTPWLGVALLAEFAWVRGLNGYGNIRPRASGDWIAWLNVVKYPPSLAYTLLTMGVNLLLLGSAMALERRAPSALEPLATLGREPLLFYVTHLLIYMGTGRLLAPRGTSLPTALAIWLISLVPLTLFCGWYARLKNRNPKYALWRLL